MLKYSKEEMLAIGREIYDHYLTIAQAAEKYGVNDVKPGLTGLAQISGRDELEIPVKAKLDGEYVQRRGFFYDLGLIFKTAFSVFRHEGVVEGGTGETSKQKEEIKQ